jgi:hypothetical protein
LSCVNIHISNIGRYVTAYVVGILCKQDIQEMYDQTSTPVHILDVYYEHNGLVCRWVSGIVEYSCDINSVYFCLVCHYSLSVCTCSKMQYCKNVNDTAVYTFIYVRLLRTIIITQ